MLTLKLTLDNGQVTVRANEAQSHSFSLHDLRLNDADLKAFVLNPRLYGSRLFQALFEDGSAAKTAFDELSKQTARTIVLVLDSPVLDSVAWEYAYNEVKQEYVVEDCAFMRALPESERPANGRLKESVERVSLLFIPANPLVDLNAEPMRALDVDGEWREMTRHITASHAPFDLLQLRPATPEQLQTSMARFRDGLVVHFSGHGAAMNDGTILLFERENGASNPLGAQEFIRTVKDKAEIVFLSACQSAAAEKTEFGNLARGLVKSGVPFALGMQFNLPDPFAPVISGQFYNWLAQGHAIPEATMQARRAVKRENEFFVGMIALYAAHPDETGKLDWRGSSASLVQMARPADVSDLPSPASGLIGRQRELMRIGTQLIEGKRSGPLTVTLHGAGGIGKTALLWQSLLRFAPSFDLTLALALDPLPSLESILGRIERFLGLPSPCANETKERETMVRERLTSKRTLLGLDNFETLNYALNEMDSEEEKTAKSLHAFFKSLAANGVTLCVTSREVTNLPGETIEDIQGLTNENGGRLFQENVVRQKDEIYIEKTQQVSEMVGGHPLALRLLASAFDDQVGTSLDQYIEDLESHLPKARDKWTEEDRHESLRASFDYTMNNFSKTDDGKELQNVLSRLSKFIAFFSPPFISAVIENEWAGTEHELQKQAEYAEKITGVLWERGLLERIVLVLPDNTLELYRIHFALRFFAKERLTNAEIVEELKRKSARLFIVYAKEAVAKSPLIAQITLHALPDFLTLAKLNNNLNDALLQYSLGRILEQFGQYDTALQILKNARGAYQDANDPLGESAVLTTMGLVHMMCGDLDTAMTFYQEALEIEEKTGDVEGKSAALVLMAYIYQTHGDFEVALQYYEQALNLEDRRGNFDGKNIILAAMADIQTMRGGNLDEAIKLFQQALNTYEKLGDLRNKSGMLASLANIYATRRDFDNSIMFYQDALNISDSLGDQRTKSIILRWLGKVHALRGDWELAVNMLRQAYEIVDNIGNLESKSLTLLELGRVYVDRNLLDEATMFFRRSLEIAEGMRNQQVRALAIGELAKVHTLRHEFDVAIELQKQKMEIAKSIGHEREIINSLCGIAHIYFIWGDLGSAMKSYQQAFEIADKIGDLFMKASVIGDMAYIEALLSNYDQAIELQKQSLEIVRASDNSREKAMEVLTTGLILYTRALAQFNIKSLTKHTVPSVLVDLRNLLGAEKFDALWHEEFGQPIPEWLTSKEKRGIFSRLFRR